MINEFSRHKAMHPQTAVEQMSEVMIYCLKEMWRGGVSSSKSGYPFLSFGQMKRTAMRQSLY